MATVLRKLKEWDGSHTGISIGRCYLVDDLNDSFRDDFGRKRKGELAIWCPNALGELGSLSITAASNITSGTLTWPTVETPTRDGSKYDRPVKGVTIDVYDVLEAFNVTCPALQHLIKKALCKGLRGHKTSERDLKDIVESAVRAEKLDAERNSTN